MSHLTQINSRITKKEVLIQACHNVGSPILEVKENFYVRLWGNKTAAAEVVCVLEGKYDLGFSKVGDGSYNFIADFAIGSCGGGSKSLEPLTKKIAQEYARLEAINWANSTKGLEKANITVKVQ